MRSKIISKIIIIISVCYAVVSQKEKDQFTEYEACIKRKVQIHTSTNALPTPQAIIVQKGKLVVKMRCDLCTRPDRGWLQMKVTWYRLRPELDEVEKVPVGKRNFYVDYKHTLEIGNVGIQHGAYYLCLYQQLVQSAYYLEVVTMEPKILVTLVGNLPRPAVDQQMNDNNLLIFTRWEEWSECSECGKVGLRRRTGICTVKKLELNIASNPRDIKALDVFKDGLPCRSSSISLLANEINVLKRRNSEILVDFCFTACATHAPIEDVTDKFGNVVGEETEYDIDEPIPGLPPLVHRETHYVRAGNGINFTCPRDKLNNNYKEIRIRWENGSTVIHPMSTRIETKGRVYIDEDDRLHFKFVRFSDNGYYSCWQNVWLVAVFRIESEKRSAVQDVPAIMYLIATMLTVGCMFVMGYRMWKASKDKRYI